MGLTNSLYSGLSGLNANSQLITVTGNNIANVNTTAFKGSRVDFQTQISQTLASGSAPTGESGGTNPLQVGLGTRIGSVSRNWTDGSFQPTGVPTEMAIEGKGFFIVEQEGSRRFTRAGNFKLDSDFNLVTPYGGLVQGYGVDDDFNVVDGALQTINIPLGNLTIAEPTRNVRFSGNLNANGDAAVNGSIISSGTLYSDAAMTTPAAAGTALTSLYDSSGTLLFATGDVLTLTGATKGGATLPDTTFEIGGATSTPDDSGTTLQDYLDYLTDVLGIDTSAGSAGLSVVGGAITIEGNTGDVNDLALDDGNIIKNQASSPTLPFTFDKSQSADGESVRTTFVAYDSLGTPMNLDLNLVLESKTSTGTNWRFYAQSQDDSDLSRVLGNGTLSFDTDGQLLSVAGNALTIDRADTGAFTPQQITLRFDEPAGSVSALTDVTSQISARSQDGTPIGTLEDFSVAEDGTIVGVFSNSELRDLGQVVLANFANPGGLMETGTNLYAVTGASGDAAIVAPGTGGAGGVVGGAIELSNVDLSQEFINLITASTGFSANSRVLSTSDRLMQELLATVR
jgi:flagellar hook protein FlgE